MSEPIGVERLKWLEELCRDSETSARLSQWEQEFMDDMRGRVLVYKENTTVSDKQIAVLQRIEERMYG